MLLRIRKINCLKVWKISIAKDEAEKSLNSKLERVTNGQTLGKIVSFRV